MLDSLGGQLVLSAQVGQFPRLSHLWADGGYKKPFTDWLKQHLGWSVQIVKRARKRTGAMDELARLLMSEAEYDRCMALASESYPGARCWNALRLVQHLAAPAQGL